MNIKINEIKIGTRFRKDVGNIDVLSKSISEVGLLHPVVISENNELIAGLRRLQSCKKLGWIEIPVHKIPLKDLLKGEFHENTARKDFTISEIVAIKRAIEPEIKKGSKQRQLTTLKQGNDLPVVEIFHDGESGKSRDIVAKYTGVSGRTLEKAEEIVRAAEKDPEKFKIIQEKVEKKQLSIDGGYNKINIELKREKILNLTPKDVPKTIQIYNKDFRESKEIPDNSIHCIITDPPYGKDYLDLWSALSEFANRVLIPSGVLICYSGHMYLPEVYHNLSSKLNYFWTISLNLKTRTLITPRNIHSYWKPIIIYYKEPLLLNQKYLTDVIDGSGYEKSYHEWQQSEFELKTLIESFTLKNQVILDPMAGSGTTLLASLKLGRKSIGYEVNPETFLIMKNRLSKCKM